MNIRMPRILQLSQMCKLLKIPLVWKNFKIMTVFITISPLFLEHSVRAVLLKNNRNGLEMFEFSYASSLLPGATRACKGQKDILQLLYTARSQQILKQVGHPSYQTRTAMSPPKPMLQGTEKGNQNRSVENMMTKSLRSIWRNQNPPKHPENDIKKPDLLTYSTSRIYLLTI